MKNLQASDVERVFGPDSIGDTIEERAASSRRIFVRSQSQLSVYNERAKGLQMSAQWALRQFGFSTLLRAVDEGAVVISANLSEPARTLREQREKLGLTIKQIAQISRVAEEVIRNAESPGSVVPIRQLRTLAQFLGLSDEKISVEPGAGADRDLAYRLRTMKSSDRAGGLSARSVLNLSEAAWITSQQLDLEDFLGRKKKITSFSEVDSNYSFPTWQRGYDLARKTREILGIAPEAPIKSVRELIDELGIPLVQAPMGPSFAGATVMNDKSRGIAVNTEGENKNVWIRRITMSHELGHLLWDPQEKLKRLHVDRYETIVNSNILNVDVIEARANAFAISFLAPPDAIREIIRTGDDAASSVSEIMKRYGVGATAAKYHFSNISKQFGVSIDVSNISSADLPSPDQEWRAREDWTVDFFPIQGVSVGRRGKFSGLIALALRQGKISSDTAASWLGVAPEEIERHREAIIDLTLH